MALVLVILGVVLWLTVAPWLGIVLLVVGLVLLVATPGPYGGRGYWHR
jgi:hypothetical protein